MNSVMKNKGSGTSYQSLFKGPNPCRKILVSVIYHLGNFDDVIQSGFWVILKITFVNLCKPIYDIIIIPVSSGLWIWKIWKGREKITRNGRSWEWRELFRLNKFHKFHNFHNFWNSFFWQNIKKWWTQAAKIEKLQSNHNYLEICTNVVCVI